MSADVKLICRKLAEILQQFKNNLCFINTHPPLSCIPDFKRALLIWLFDISLTSYLKSIILTGYSGKPEGMMQVKHNNFGTVAVTVVLLIIIVLAVLSIARHFWADSTTKHFDGFISVYIIENEDLNEDDVEV